MRKRREWTAFDLTPLIDIVFLLLIFFMVFSVFKKDEFILNIDLPEASAAQDLKNVKRILIEMNEQSLSMNGQKISFEILQEKVKDLPKDVLVILSIDKNVVYDRVVQLLNVFKTNKVENISLLVKQ